jgi:hypothetical protein
MLLMLLEVRLRLMVNADLKLDELTKVEEFQRYKEIQVVEVDHS